MCLFGLDSRRSRAYSPIARITLVKAYDVLFGHFLRKLDDVFSKRIVSGNASNVVELRAFRNAYTCVPEAFLDNYDTLVKESEINLARFEFGIEGVVTVEQTRLVHRAFERDPSLFIRMMDLFGVDTYETSALHQLEEMQKIAQDHDADFR